MTRRRVVVLGGGAAGCLAAQALARQPGVEMDVTLVTRRPRVPVGPLLPAVAAGSLDPRVAAAPLRPRLGRARLLVAEVSGVDAVSRQIQLSGPEVQAGLVPANLPYDDVIAALGAAPEAADHALPFSGIDDATRLRERLVRALEAASGEDSPRKRKLLTTVAVLGGDSVACALAGELLVSLRQAASAWPRLERDEPRVLLLSPGELLEGTPRPLAQPTRRGLEALGVEVRVGAQVTAIADDHLRMSLDGREERVEVRTVVRVDRRKAPPALGPIRAAGGLVPVAATLASETFPGLWALGGCAEVDGIPAGSPAIETLEAQAALLARNVAARARGAPLDRRLAPSPLLLLAYAPGQAAGSLGPLPLPSGLAWRLWLHRELRRWWPTISPLAALLAPLPAPPGLLLRAEFAPPALYQTPAPPAALPVPPIPLGDATAIQPLPPVTLPLPPPRR